MLTITCLLILSFLLPIVGIPLLIIHLGAVLGFYEY
jgi:hypothetical protein